MDVLGFIQVFIGEVPRVAEDVVSLMATMRQNQRLLGLFNLVRILLLLLP